MTDDRTEDRDDEQAPDPGEAPGEAEETPAADEGVPLDDTNVFDMLRAAIGLFVQEGWIALGLQPRYGSAETKMDLHCAKVAIDTTQILVEQLGEEATGDEKREFDRALTDLRVNFMSRKKKAEEE